MKNRYNIVGGAGLPYCPGTYCQNWDSLAPQYLTDRRTGDTIGRLMPVNPYAIGIHQHLLLGYQRHS